MDISSIIAQILGIFFVVVGITMVANGKGIAAAVEETAQHKGLLFTWGILALLIGATIVALNNAWTSGVQLLITVLGWAALIKGMFILFSPGIVAVLYRKFATPGMMVGAGIVVIILGMMLLY
jgi:hypothetical protein